MPQLFGFGLFFLLACCDQAFAHERIVLDSRHASPGIRLEMQLLPPTVTEPDARYRLEAFGFPRGVKLLLWPKEFDHSVHQPFPAVFQADKFGRVFARNADQDGRPRRLGSHEFWSGPVSAGSALASGPHLVGSQASSFCQSDTPPCLCSRWDLRNRTPTRFPPR